MKRPSLPWLPLLVAAPLCLVTMYLLAVLAASQLAAPILMEKSLEETQHRVERFVATPLLIGRSDASVLVLVAPGPPLSVEQQAVERFVRGGGEIWVVGSDLSILSMGEAAAPKVLPGRMHGTDGARPQVEMPGGRNFSAWGLRGLNLAGTDYQPIATTTSLAFRDSDGDGILDSGEPAGRHVVAAQGRVGEGRVVVVATDLAHDPGLDPLLLFLGEQLDTSKVAVFKGDHPSWWAPAVSILRALVLPRSSPWAALPVALAALGMASLLHLRLVGSEHAPTSSVLRRLVHDYQQRLPPELPGDTRP